MIPPSRQLPAHCPRYFTAEEVRGEYGTYWKVTIGGRNAELTYDEFLAVVALFARPHSLPETQPMFWGAFQTDAEREYRDRIMASQAKLRESDPEWRRPQASEIAEMQAMEITRLQGIIDQMREDAHNDMLEQDLLI